MSINISILYCIHSLLFKHFIPENQFYFKDESLFTVTFTNPIIRILG